MHAIFQVFGMLEKSYFFNEVSVMFERHVKIFFLLMEESRECMCFVRPCLKWFRDVLCYWNQWIPWR
jgi:hypothetical protein